jgi:hypothetical protein
VQKAQYEALDRRLADIEQRLDNIDSTLTVEIEGEHYPITRVFGAPTTEEIEAVMDEMEKAELPDEGEVN